MKHVALYVASLTFTILLATTLVFAVSGCPAIRVSADDSNGYLRVITEDTPFYSDKNADAPLFYLPYTYYVKVLERGDFYTHVEYAVKGSSIDGYVPTNKLFEDGLAVSKPYPSIIVTTSETAVLYRDYALTSSIQYVFEGRNLYYYGKFQSLQGKTVYYVSYNDRLGYVKEEDLMPFAVPNHPNELTFIVPEEPEVEPTIAEEETDDVQKTESVLNIRVAIIAVLGLAGVIALIVALGKKPKAAPAASYYDENDFE